MAGLCQWIGEVGATCLCCQFQEASKDILCAPFKILIPCCPWERLLDPVYACVCCACLAISGAAKKRPTEEKKAVEARKMEPPAANEIERMNRAMYETDPGENEKMVAVAKAAGATAK